MNRVFKTKWSAAHQQYVVTDEHHATKGKAAKSAVAIAVAAFMMAAGAQAAYKDPNPNISSASVAEAQRAFETAEYQKDWGLAAMNASKAYALGFTGKDVAVGVMDSGALLQDHPDLKGDRFHAVKVEISPTVPRATVILRTPRIPAPTSPVTRFLPAVSLNLA